MKQDKNDPGYRTAEQNALLGDLTTKAREEFRDEIISKTTLNIKDFIQNRDLHNEEGFKNIFTTFNFFKVRSRDSANTVSMRNDRYLIYLIDMYEEFSQVLNLYYESSCTSIELDDMANEIRSTIFSVYKAIVSNKGFKVKSFGRRIISDMRLKLFGIEA